MLSRQQIVVGSLQCNCQVLVCDRSKEAVVIDPGDEAPKIIAHLQKMGASVKYLLHTHAHFDHIGATSSLKTSMGGLIALHRDDNKLYESLPIQGHFFGMSFESPSPVDLFFEHEQDLTFGDFSLKVIHTPGHSPGSVCFKLNQESEDVFSGDTLFCRSVGRSDLWGGDGRQLVSSIKERLFTLEDEIAVFPGHGPSTTIGEERRENPFIR